MGQEIAMNATQEPLFVPFTTSFLPSCFNNYPDLHGNYFLDVFEFYLLPMHAFLNNIAYFWFYVIRKSQMLTEKKNLIRKWTKCLKRHFTEVGTQMANTHLKRCSLSLTTRELHIKVILRYYYMTILTAQINLKKKCLYQFLLKIWRKWIFHSL